MAKDKIKVEDLTHTEAKRRNIATAEQTPVMPKKQQKAVPVIYERRNRDLDPQLVWRGKDEQDLNDLAVPAPPLYIQEKVSPKVLIEDLKAESQRLAAERASLARPVQNDLFADFNGIPDGVDKTEFY